MSPQDLLTFLSRRPFEPFRLWLSDGTLYEIRHPELLMVGRTSAVIGVSDEARQPPIYDRYSTVALSHIVRMEPIGQTA